MTHTKLKQLHGLLETLNLNSILIYASKNEDACMRWLLNKPSIISCYIIVSKEKSVIVLPRYIEEEYGISEIKTDDEFSYNEILKEKCKGRVGFIGKAPYADLSKLKCEIIEINPEFENLIIIKNEFNLEMIKKSAEYTSKLLNPKNIKRNITELELASILKSKIYGDGHSEAFDICISSGNRLKIGTALSPSPKIIEENDIICIDCGVIVNGFYSDLTRCYFKDNEIKEYVLLKSIIDTVSKKIKPGILSSDVMDLFEQEFTKHGLNKFFVKCDLGHGVGYELHEHPSIGEDVIVLQENMVITLEPELDLGNIKIRHEDMFIIKKDGCIKIS